MSIYVDGNTVRKTEPEYEDHELEAERSRRAALRARQARKAESQKRRIRTAVGVVAVVMVLLIAMMMLTEVVKNNSLTSQINSIEAELAELTAQNDSREYDINRSVNMNTVIKVATEELGMVRGNASQIVTYENSDSEYIQQVAAIPQE